MPTHAPEIHPNDGKIHTIRFHVSVDGEILDDGESLYIKLLNDNASPSDVAPTVRASLMEMGEYLSHQGVLSAIEYDDRANFDRIVENISKALQK